MFSYTLKYGEFVSQENPVCNVKHIMFFQWEPINHCHHLFHWIWAFKKVLLFFSFHISYNVNEPHKLLTLIQKRGSPDHIHNELVQNVCIAQEPNEGEDMFVIRMLNFVTTVENQSSLHFFEMLISYLVKLKKNTKDHHPKPNNTQTALTKACHHYIPTPL